MTLWRWNICTVFSCKSEFLAKFPKFLGNDSSLQKHTGDMVNHFAKTGTIHKSKYSERPSVSEDIVENVRGTIEENPRTSMRRLSLQMVVSVSTCHKIVNWKTNLHPWKLPNVRGSFNSNNDDMPDLTLISPISGYVNSQNFPN